jgi:hypothetical protein
MRRVCFAQAALLLAVAVAPAVAEEVKSGVEVGGSITTYSTTKCGGIDDGVKEGASLCYT